MAVVVEVVVEIELVGSVMVVVEVVVVELISLVFECVLSLAEIVFFSNSVDEVSFWPMMLRPTGVDVAEDIRAESTSVESSPGPLDSSENNVVSGQTQVDIIVKFIFFLFIYFLPIAINVAELVSYLDSFVQGSFH
jgi:hypothetical protein